MTPMLGMSRRDYFRWMGVGAGTMAAGTFRSFAMRAQEPEVQESQEVIADRQRRMQWWHAAKFGMFIHWGLYSVYGHHEWAMEEEGIPVAEYEELAKRFKPQPTPARSWAK